MKLQSMPPLTVLALVLALLTANIASAKINDAEKAIAQLEKEWLSSLVTGDASIIERIESDDIIVTSPDGSIGHKADDLDGIKTKKLTASSMDIEDMKVRVYGKTAVANFKFIGKGVKFADHDMSGEYRETDTWVMSGGKWQVVSSHFSKIAKP
jgi:ketosteroid isomerase-like protein